MSEMIQVTREQFYEFIKSYNGNLKVDVNAMPDPPVKTFNDFSIGNWPDSVVARCKVFPNDKYYTDVMNNYFVGENGRCECEWEIKL